MQSLPIFTAALIAGALAVADATAQRRGGRRAEPPKLEHLTFEEKRFESEALGGQVPYGIYLPKSYSDAENAERRYPLILWLHGMFEDHVRFHERGGGAVLDRLAGSEEIPEILFVCANGGRSSFYINGLGDGSAYEDMVREDLIAHLEANYRVVEDRGLRAIAGVSMGGYGALKIALKDPGAFGVVAAHSAALLTRNPEDLIHRYRWLQQGGRGRTLLTSLFGDPVDADKWTAENVLVMAESIEPQALDGLKIYFDCGDADRYGFDATNLELHGMLEQREVPHTWRLVEGGNHGWRSGYNQTAVPHSLRFIAEQFAAHRGRKGLKGLLGQPPTDSRRGDKSIK